MRRLKRNEIYLIEKQEQEMKSQIIRFMKDEEGATAIEYGLIAGLVSIAIIGGLVLISPQLNRIFRAVATALTGAVAPT